MDLTALMAVRAISSSMGLGRVLTLGRQELHVNHAEVRWAKLAQYQSSKIQGKFAEECLLGAFGAEIVDSIDASNYQNATFIIDLNEDIPSRMLGKYDTVLDFGTSEHIYDIRQVFKNVSDAVKVGGQIVHILPTNGFSGHGFYQFSPEFFFSTYSESRGFQSTKVFVVNPLNPYTWYQISSAPLGERTDVYSAGPLYVVCFTKKSCGASQKSVQQSDYLTAWDEANVEIKQVPSATRDNALARLRLHAFEAFPPLKHLATKVYLWARVVHKAHHPVWSNQPLTKLEFSKIMEPFLQPEPKVIDTQTQQFDSGKISGFNK